MRFLGRHRPWWGVVVLLALAPCRVGAQAPAPETGARTVNATLENNQLRVVGSGGGAIIVPGATPLVEGCDPGVKWNVQLQPQPTGADLIFTFTNTAPGARQIGAINIGTLALGPSVVFRDMRHGGEGVNADCNTFVTRSWIYPGEAYSPAWVVSNQDVAVGVSLLYPVLEARHEVRLSLASPLARGPGTENARGWLARFQLGGAGQRLAHGAEIGQGQTRTYVVSLRVVNNPKEWVRTLQPYRDFFRATYGGVRYARRPEPVMALSMSDAALITDENPAGWNTAYRPDLGGWSRFVRHARVELAGWESFLIASPSGQYAANRQHNPPYQFASAWNASEEIATALDPYNGLPAISKTGKRLALMWARSYQVSAGWDQARVETMDLDKPEHVQAALSELENAVRAGATTVVLGNSLHTLVPAWDQYTWIEQLTMHFTSTGFVIDPSCPDFLHTLAGESLSAVMETGRPMKESDFYTIRQPHFMADFLLPGHETWAVLRYDMLKQAFNTEIDSGRVLSDVRRLAALGYVPVAYFDGNLDPGVKAAETWKKSVPADLQIEAPVIARAEPARKVAKATPRPQPAQPAPTKPEPAPKAGSKDKKAPININVKPGTEADAAVDPDESIPDRDSILSALRRARLFSPKATMGKSGKPNLGPAQVVPADNAPKK